MTLQAELERLVTRVPRQDAEVVLCARLYITTLEATLTRVLAESEAINSSKSWPFAHQLLESNKRHLYRKGTSNGV